MKLKYCQLCIFCSIKDMFCMKKKHPCKKVSNKCKINEQIIKQLKERNKL